MDAAALRERITQRFIDDVEEAMYPSVSMLERAEAALVTPDDLADYAEMLVKKVEETQFPSTEILNRLDRLVGQLEQLEQREKQQRRARQSGAGDS